MCTQGDMRECRGSCLNVGTLELCTQGDVRGCTCSCLNVGTLELCTQEIMKDTGYRKGMCFRNVNCVYSLLFFRAFLSSFLSSCDAAELKIESAVFLLPFCSSAHRFKRQNMMVFVKDLVCLRSSL